jgi:hypothetical protein
MLNAIRITSNLENYKYINAYLNTLRLDVLYFPTKIKAS